MSVRQDKKFMDLLEKFAEACYDYDTITSNEFDLKAIEFIKYIDEYVDKKCQEAVEECKEHVEFLKKTGFFDTLEEKQ